MTDARETVDTAVGERPGLRHGISWSFVGGIGAGALLFAQLIFAGRLLGPEQFGTFSLIQAIAMVLLIPSLAGFDLASSRAIARAESIDGRRRIAASSIAAVTTCSLATCAIVVLLDSALAELLGTTAQVIGYSAGFTVLLAQRWLMERHLSGLGRFREQAAVRLAEAVVTIAAFATLQLLELLDDFRSLVLAYSLGAVVVLVGSHLVDGHRVRFRDASRAEARALAVYGGLMSGSYLFSTLLLQSDRFAINGLLGERALGIYAAYASGTVFVTIQLLLILSNVLHPAMSRMPEKSSFVRRLDRLAPLAFLGGSAGLVALLAAVLALFGSAYRFELVLAVIFACWAALALINGTYAVVVNAHSERSCARELAFQPVRLVFLAAWFGILGMTNSLTLELAAGGMLVSELLEAVNLRLVLRGYVILAPRVDSARNVD